MSAVGTGTGRPTSAVTAVLEFAQTFDHNKRICVRFGHFAGIDRIPPSNAGGASRIARNLFVTLVGGASRSV